MARNQKHLSNNHNLRTPEEVAYKAVFAVAATFREQAKEEIFCSLETEIYTLYQIEAVMKQYKELNDSYIAWLNKH